MNMKDNTKNLLRELMSKWSIWATL